MTVAAVKRLPIHHYSADYIFWFENKILLKPVLGGMAGVAHFITGHV